MIGGMASNTEVSIYMKQGKTRFYSRQKEETGVKDEVNDRVDTQKNIVPTDHRIKGRW